MKKGLIIILILSSVIFIALSVRNFNSTPPINSISVHYSTVVYKDRLDELNTILNENFVSNEDTLLAVFFIYPKNCTSCFNEVFEYLTILDRKEEKFGVHISLYGVFHHTKIAVAKRFKKTTDLTFDEIIAVNGKKLYDKGFLTFNGQEANNQLVFFDGQKDIFFKIFLPTGIVTSRKEKKEVIDLVLNYNN